MAEWKTVERTQGKGMKFSLLLELYNDKSDKISFDFDGTLSSVKGNPNMSMVKELKKLSKKNSIVILTSRSETPASDKEIKHFIKKNSLKVDDIIYTNGMFKANFIKKLGIINHFDDDPEEIVQIKKLGLQGELIDPDQNIKDDFEDEFGIEWEA